MALMKSLGLPEPPEGFKYDMSKNPPLLIKKSAKESKRAQAIAAKAFRKTAIVRPTEDEQVNLLRNDYDKPI